MKHLLSFLFALCSLVALSQEEKEPAPSKDTSYSRGPKAFLDPPVSQDRFIFEMHHDFFESVPDEMELRLWSPGMNAYIMYDYPLAKSAISVAWGYGFSSFNIHSNGSFERDTTNAGYVNFEAFASNYAYEKNKVSSNFLEIPIEMRLRTRTETPFKISIGGKIGYMVNIHTKTVDENGKRKFYQVPEAAKWRYGLTTKLGFGRWSAFAFYSLSTYLHKDKGVALRPITVGLSLALI